MYCCGLCQTGTYLGWPSLNLCGITSLGAYLPTWSWQNFPLKLSCWSCTLSWYSYKGTVVGAQPVPCRLLCLFGIRRLASVVGVGFGEALLWFAWLNWKRPSHLWGDICFSCRAYFLSVIESTHDDHSVHLEGGYLQWWFIHHPTKILQTVLFLSSEQELSESGPRIRTLEQLRGEAFLLAIHGVLLKSQKTWTLKYVNNRRSGSRTFQVFQTFDRETLII